jgi:peptidoglycan DL-endopeptidase CwlO
VTLPVGGSAESAGELERRAQALREKNASLAAGAQTAAGDLVAIERRLTQVRAELGSFRARAAQVQERRRDVTADLRVARSALRLSQRALAGRLQSLYEQGEAGTLEVILGAGSLDEMLSGIETMDQSARQDESLIRTARSASARLARISRRLAAQERELEQLAAVRAAAAASLADARVQRLQTIAALRSTSRANAGTIAALEAKARTLASVSAPQLVTTHAPGAPRLQPGTTLDGVRSLTVVATGYSLPGHTASGSAVGWGAVAVDPSVIPLGSRLSVPGYGLGVAADTGGAIRGARIDLWFPTVAQARTWGSRVVTVTISS